jgi:hypothetical protein
MYFFDGEAIEKMIGFFSAFCGKRNAARLFAAGRGGVSNIHIIMNIPL